MSPHYHLSVVPDILAIRTDTGHGNSRMHRLLNIGVLHTKPQFVPYIETIEQALESPFQTLKLCGMTKNKYGVSIMVAKGHA